MEWNGNDYSTEKGWMDGWMEGIVVSYIGQAGWAVGSESVCQNPSRGGSLGVL